MLELEAVKSALAKGDLLRAYELATAALAENERNPRARYFQVLALARMDELALAQAYYDAYLADNSANDIDISALAARLTKDRAWKAEGETRLQLLRSASSAYQQVYEATGDSFPGVNAATLAFLSSDRARASALAKSVLRDLGDQHATYFAAVTAAEAHLILGHIGDAERFVDLALKLPDCDFGARSSTTRQLDQIVNELGRGQEIVDRLRPPPVLNYCGHMFSADVELEAQVRSQIDDRLDRLGCVIAYGGLSCGADILIAEAILARGGELNVVLPFAIEDYVSLSVAVGGPEWVPRFERCLKSANDVEIGSPTPVMQQDQQLAYASSLVMGYSCLRAEHLITSAIQLSVWDGGSTSAIAGTGADVARWQGFGGAAENIAFDRSRYPAPQTQHAQVPSSAKQTVRAMIFADFAKFSSIGEGDLPVFWESVLGKAASVISRYDSFVCSRNTWGDGLFVVSSNATAAANLTLNLRDELRLDQMPIFGENAGMRIGIHLGPVFEAIDPVSATTTFYGRAVNLAARIEPIASTGEIYVTRQFAAILALENPGKFVLSLVGRIALAKNFGEATMYRLSSSL